MASSTIAYITIDAGGTFLKSAVLDPEGLLLPGSYQSVKSFSEGSKEEILNAYREVVVRGVKYTGDRNAVLKGVGIASPGPFNIYTARPLMRHKFRAIYGMDLRSYFQKLPGVPGTLPIEFVHDANAVLMGEMWKGDARDYQSAAAITMGTGLGFSVSENNEVLCNDIGGPAISIYKLPYKEGILEDYVSQRGFLKIYEEISGNNTADIEVADIGKWADEGDVFSMQTFREVATILAGAIKEILIEKRIECLVFAGQISRSFHHMEETISGELKEVSSLKRITRVKSFENASLHGVLQAILNRKKPGNDYNIHHSLSDNQPP